MLTTQHSACTSSMPKVFSSAWMVALLLGFLLCPVEGQCCSSSLCPLLLQKTNPFLAYEHLLPEVGVHTGFQWSTGHTDLTAPV